MELEYIVLGILFVLAVAIVTWRVMLICRRSAKKNAPSCSCGCSQKFRIPDKK
jgi:hypothetical protein